MGGISRGSTRLSGNDTVWFLGELSLANNGGFSSVRSPAQDLGLGNWDGIALRVRGDGRTYNVSALRNDRRNELNFYQQSFETVAEEWGEVRIPFDQLIHRVMGWARPNSRIAAEEIRSLSFGISDKTTLPFALEIDWIKAYRDS
ncbi:MAG: NADH dehydrogenase [ubiquinone] 1 alpha subcomplex assembly factor 1 [Pseudohongiellaceae bacterium]|jgi:NADH dehydrogenase [ubiquinone] 1 alpha subcomplex assembly factor 1